MSSEYLIAIPVDDIPNGQIYKAGESLPLHCTLMHWFPLESGLRRDQLESFLVRNVSGPVELALDIRAKFGPNNDVPVWTLKRLPALLQLHTEVFAFLAKHDSLPSELQWVGAGWSPHITISNNRPSVTQRRFIGNKLVLIERGRENKIKLVQAVIPLG